MKNLFGLIPGAVYGWPKNVLHWAGIDESIADLHAAFPRHFCLVDGIVGMEGNGPIQGKAKPAEVIVGGRDMVAVDAACCRVMGTDPARTRYLKLAETQGQTAEENIATSRGVHPGARTAFELVPEFRGIRLQPA